MGFPHITLEFPYKRQSPVSKKVKTYENIEQVWEEIIELVEGWTDSRFSLGRNLYFHLPLFMNPKWIIDNEELRIMDCDEQFSEFYGLQYLYQQDDNNPVPR